MFAAFQARSLIDEVNPVLIFIMHDIWLFERYLHVLAPYRDRSKIVAYLPLDRRIRNEEDAAALVQADHVIAYSQFGRAQFEQAFRRLRGKQAARVPGG